MTDLANMLGELGGKEDEVCFIDAMFLLVKACGHAIDSSECRDGLKITEIVDRHGLPRAVSIHVANHHEVTPVQLRFDFYMIEAKPENLIGDRAYGNDKLMKHCKK